MTSLAWSAQHQNGKRTRKDRNENDPDSFHWIWTPQKSGLMLVIDAGGDESVFVQKDLGSDEQANIHQSRFWAWAKRKQESYWKGKHA